MHMMTGGAPLPWMALPEVYRILVKRLRTDTDSCRVHRRECQAHSGEGNQGFGPEERPEWALFVSSALTCTGTQHPECPGWGA